MKPKQKKTVSKKLRDWIKRQHPADVGMKPKVSSAHMKRTIDEAFRRSAEVDADRLVVTAHDGTVDLWGNVRTWAEIREAERLSWAAPGVTKVDSHLHIIR
jgi:osmotically-inducible protein OsmY